MRNGRPPKISQNPTNDFFTQRHLHIPTAENKYDFCILQRYLIYISNVIAVYFMSDITPLSWLRDEERTVRSSRGGSPTCRTRLLVIFLFQGQIFVALSKPVPL